VRYVDGFVLTVPKKNIKAYTKMARDAGKIWMKYGALDYIECVGDDLNPKWAKLTFPKLTRSKPSETVLYSFIIYRNKKHRDEVNKKVMKDPYMCDPKNKDMKMPFDMNKMAYGGFKSIVDFKR